MVQAESPGGPAGHARGVDRNGEPAHENWSASFGDTRFEKMSQIFPASSFKNS